LRSTAIRTLLVVGLVVAGIGLARLVYFTFYFDTWMIQHVPAPDGLEVPFEESVLVPSDELAAQARDGTDGAWRMVLLGGPLALAGAVGLWLARRRASGT
jgi:hypothetical protein